MVKLEFYDPSGAMEIAQSHAPRLASLEGKRIGLVSNDQWQAHRMLPQIKAMLEADFKGSVVMPADSFPQGIASIGTEETADRIKQSGVDAVIIGNAA